MALSVIPTARNTQRHPQPEEPQTTAGFLSYHSSVVNVPLVSHSFCNHETPTLLASSSPCPPQVVTANPRAQVLTLPPLPLPVKSTRLCFSSSCAAPRLPYRPIRRTQLQKQNPQISHRLVGHNHSLYHAHSPMSNPHHFREFHLSTTQRQHMHSSCTYAQASDHLHT